MPLVTITGASTTVYSFQKKVAEPHRLIMKEETLHSLASKFQLQQSRGTPAANGNSQGKQKTYSKVTIGVVAPGLDGVDLSDDIIGNVDVSIPVGVSSTDVDTFVDCLVAYVESSVFRALIEKGDLADALA